VPLQDFDESRSVIGCVKNLSRNAVLASALERSCVRTIGCDDNDLSSRRALAREMIDDRLEIRAASGSKNCNARLHAAILLSRIGRSKTRTSFGMILTIVEFVAR
jgi:hypothetical protein